MGHHRQRLFVQPVMSNIASRLPLALAMPSPLVAAAVVTQTVVELLGMVVLVRILPRLLKDGTRPPARR